MPSPSPSRLNKSGSQHLFPWQVLAPVFLLKLKSFPGASDQSRTDDRRFTDDEGIISQGASLEGLRQVLHVAKKLITAKFGNSTGTGILYNT